MSHIVSRRDLDFLFYEVFDLDGVLQSERYGEYDRDLITAVLDTAQSIAENTFAPLAASLDANEPKFVDGKVEMMSEVADALEAYAEAGLLTSGFDYEDGGMQLPFAVSHAIGGLFSCANTAASNYMFLTAANANMLTACGSDELKARFLPPMLEGRWFGTMCLSETQAGSSLADIRTTATPQEDGTYHLEGTKMWISGGDHPLSENIVHMVLAKTPNAPAGVKGISLFLVPKFRVEADGSVGDYNHIALAGLNHKMGQRGTTNCLLNFGEGGASVGYLVGEEGAGLANMFHMMNEARIGVGLGAVMAGLGGYLYSLDYAHERRQGRPIGAKDPAAPQIPIIEHADVRRMLMAQKVWVEGGLALIQYCAWLQDRQAIAEQKEQSQALELLLELLTPVAKSWPSEYCLEANKLAIQILGGYGYTRDYPVERFYRDNRLNHIHEGTWAIHGIDILGRKVRLGNGAALDLLAAEMSPDLEAGKSSEKFAAQAAALDGAWAEVLEAVNVTGECQDKGLALANATLFLNAFGHVVVGWLWLRQALAAERASKGQADQPFYAGKHAAFEYFFVYELPKARLDLQLVATLDDTCFAIAPEVLHSISDSA
ncbi:MAG: acyl-CoA dehydrogenase [Pseudomonadota bacterium]